MMTQNKTKIVIIGASGFGREVLWTIHDCNHVDDQYDVLGFIDDDLSLHGKKINELFVLGDINWLTKNLDKNVKCIIAIGNCFIRKQIAEKLEKFGFTFETLIHPSVIHSTFVKIGSGSIIQAGCIITVDVTIGEHVHMNLNTTIGHDSIIENFVTINPGVHVNGNTVVKEGSNIGSGTVMKQGLNIGNWAIIGAGAVLISNVPDNSTVVGNPGKIKKFNNKLS